MAFPYKDIITCDRIPALKKGGVKLRRRISCWERERDVLNRIRLCYKTCPKTAKSQKVQESDTFMLQNVSKNSKISKSARIGYASVTKRIQKQHFGKIPGKFTAMPGKRREYYRLKARFTAKSRLCRENAVNLNHRTSVLKKTACSRLLLQPAANTLIT